jgi:hypothetical protein
MEAGESMESRSRRTMRERNIRCGAEGGEGVLSAPITPSPSASGLRGEVEGLGFRGGEAGDWTDFGRRSRVVEVGADGTRGSSQESCYYSFAAVSSSNSIIFFSRRKYSPLQSLLLKRKAVSGITLLVSDFALR